MVMQQGFSIRNSDLVSHEQVFMEQVLELSFTTTQLVTFTVSSPKHSHYSHLEPLQLLLVLGSEHIWGC